VGTACAQYSLETNISADMIQSISGRGFFSSYAYAQVPDHLGNLEGAVGPDLSGMKARRSAHGSGEIRDDSRLQAYSYYYEDGIVPVQGGVTLEPVIEDDNTTAFPYLQIRADAGMKHSPFAMALGLGYYSRNPINRSSLFEDAICIENLDTGSLMRNEIDHARAFDRSMVAFSDYIDQANTSMNVLETIEEGRAAIRFLQLEEIPVPGESEEMDDLEPEAAVLPHIFQKKARPQIEIEEVYQGSFQLKKILSFAASIPDEEEDDFWLPCCFEGFSGLNDSYRRERSIEGIFDCTCGLSVAAAPRPQALR